MSEPTNQELKELILNLDKDMRVGFESVRGEIKRVEEKLEGEIKRVEEKLEAKIDGLDKRVSNEQGDNTPGKKPEIHRRIWV